MRVWIEKTIVKGRLDRQEGELELGKVLWSPIKDKRGADIYSSMRDVKENDIVFHLVDNNEFVGISKVNRTYSERKIEIGSPWDGPCYIIELKDFTKLTTPIQRDQILSSKNKELLDNIRLNNKVFYNSELNLNQGAYLTHAPDELVYLFNKTYEENSNKSIPFITESIFKVFRDKMASAGFIFEAEQPAMMQKRGTELKFIHPKLINRFSIDGLKSAAKKFYIKKLSDEPNGVIGLSTGKSSPLYDSPIFSEPNQIDTHNNYPAWSSKNNSFENLLDSINKYLIYQPLIMNFPLNTILYGPPGTGKTYNTVLRAAEIIENRNINSYNEALEIFKAKLHDQIEFITFHQNYSYEDFIQGLRPDIENDKELTFERRDGIFKVIADKALKNIRNSEKPLVAKKIFEVAFNEYINPLLEGEVNEIEVQMKKVSCFITAITNKSIEFRKASGNSSHTMSIATLKKMYESESVLDIQGLSYYYSPLLDAILKIGKDNTGRKEITQKKNFVIIIDEINRANISRVFGELITLIEPDKRSHGSIPLEARLPSGDPFIVPSNLYIIGTMNTADKSIALLDIALRRRFEFVSMYPLYEIQDEEIHDVEILKKINEQIINSKGHDFQIGHAYFMGEENRDLVKRMNKKVIPLLLEYYMNDEKEVISILKKAGLTIEENSWPLRITGLND